MIILEKRTAASVDNPAAGKFAIFINSADGHVTVKDSTGTLTIISANPIP